jgi:hypothetical protein
MIYLLRSGHPPRTKNPHCPWEMKKKRSSREKRNEVDYDKKRRNESCNGKRNDWTKRNGSGNEGRIECDEASMSARAKTMTTVMIALVRTNIENVGSTRTRRNENDEAAQGRYHRLLIDYAKAMRLGKDCLFLPTGRYILCHLTEKSNSYSSYLFFLKDWTSTVDVSPSVIRP